MFGLTDDGRGPVQRVTVGFATGSAVVTATIVYVCGVGVGFEDVVGAFVGLVEQLDVVLHEERGGVRDGRTPSRTFPFLLVVCRVLQRNS